MSVIRIENWHHVYFSFFLHSLPFFIPYMLFFCVVAPLSFFSSMSVKIELMLIESEHDTATFWVKGYIFFFLEKDPIKFLLVVNAQLWLIIFYWLYSSFPLKCYSYRFELLTLWRNCMIFINSFAIQIA